MSGAKVEARQVIEVMVVMREGGEARMRYACSHEMARVMMFRRKGLRQMKRMAVVTMAKAIHISPSSMLCPMRCPISVPAAVGRRLQTQADVGEASLGS